MNKPRVIYRRAPSVGNPPTMQIVQRRDGQLNTRRLRNASPLQTMQPYSRRPLSKAGVYLLLFVVAALAAIVVFAIAASQPRTAHGQALVEPWPQECATGAACHSLFNPFTPR